MKHKKSKKNEARNVVLTALGIAEKNNKNFDIILHDLFKQLRVAPKDKALAYEITCGVIRHRLTLNHVIAAHSKTGIQRMHPVLQNILRIALYQLLYLNGVPDYAVVNEAIKQARKNLYPGAAGFANAVLRAVISEEKHISLPDPATDPVSYYELKYSHPRWLVERWLSMFGAKTCEQLFATNNCPPPLFVRTNQTKISPTELVRELDAQNVKSVIVDESLGALSLHYQGNLSQLAAFKQGLFYVQDLTAMKVAAYADPQPGQRVLDVCAAPGGKATHCAELMQNSGIVIANERTYDKTRRIKQNRTRLAASAIVPLVADAASVSKLFGAETFDRIILDAPCSNSGVLRRRVEARYRLQPDDFEFYHTKQLAFLTAAAPLLRSDAILVYSTCSIDEEENQQVVAAFLEKNPDFTLLDQCLTQPSIDNGDGGYMARIKRQ